MEITFWGTRGSIPSPGPETLRHGGNTSCIGIRTRSGSRIILDAGSGIRPLGLQLARETPADCSIFISHTHWDHIHGLPFFAPLFIPGNHIVVYGTPDPLSFKTIGDALALQMDHRYFPVLASELKADVEYRTLAEGEVVDLMPALVMPVMMNHTVLSYGYLVQADNRRLFYTGDHEPFENIYQPGEDGYEDFEQAMAEKRGHMLKLIRGVDVLIADAQYTEEEYAGKRGWGHSSFRGAVDLALEAEAGCVFLAHHDPTRSDAELDGILDSLREYYGGEIDIHMAQEGLSISLPEGYGGSD